MCIFFAEFDYSMGKEMYDICIFVEGRVKMSDIVDLKHNGMFDDILSMIYSAKQKAEYQVNTTIIELYWQIGSYVSERITKDGWGKSTVKELSAYILSKEPGIRGYSAQNIWRKWIFI